MNILKYVSTVKNAQGCWYYRGQLNDRRINKDLTCGQDDVNERSGFLDRHYHHILIHHKAIVNPLVMQAPRPVCYS